MHVVSLIKKKGRPCFYLFFRNEENLLLNKRSFISDMVIF